MAEWQIRVGDGTWVDVADGRTAKAAIKRGAANDVRVRVWTPWFDPQTLDPKPDDSEGDRA